jgi:hypothetical protein
MVATTTAAAAVPSVVPMGHRIAERLPFLVDTLAHEARVLGVEVDAATARACATATWGDVCGALPVADARRMARRCRRLLSVADAGLERAGGPTDGMRGLAATALRQAVATEAMRLSAFLRALSLVGCEARADQAGEPVTLTLLDGGRRILVEPERGLDPTKRWAIRTTGPAATILPAKAGAASLPDVPALSAARALTSRLEQLARDAPHWPAFPAFAVDLAEAAPTRPFWHPPVRLRTDGTGDITLRDPRNAFRRPSEPVRCPSPALPATALHAGLRHDAIGEVRRGIVEPGLSFLVALPRAQTRGVVLLVHSLEADGRTILDMVGDDLASVGLASVAFDLPLHGERARHGEPFLAADDPTRFARNALAAVGDILAVTAMVRHCPDAVGLPSGVATDRIGFLGYSIGATIGLLALAADPALAPAVLLAPAGDIQRWQTLLLARHIDVIDTVCIGPGATGAVCADDASCGPGAVCDRPPGLFLIAPAVLPPARLLIGDAEPLGATALLRQPVDARPILVQYATDDAIVFASQTRQVADALALPFVSADAELPSRAVRAWPGGHEFILQPAVRAEAARFLARNLAGTL